MGCISLELCQCSTGPSISWGCVPSGTAVLVMGVQCYSAWVLLSAGMHNTYLQNVCPRARSCWDLYCLIPYLPALPKSKWLLLCGFGEYFCRSGKPTRAEEPRAGANTIWQADNADGSQQTLNSGAVVWQHTKFESVSCIAGPHVSQPHGLEYWSIINWLLVQIRATLIF